MNLRTKRGMNRDHSYCHRLASTSRAARRSAHRRAVTAVTIAIVMMTFAFSLGNVTRLCVNLGITAWIAWLVGSAVDLSVVGLLTGMRSLSLHGDTPADLVSLRRMLRFCGLLTLALNTAGSIADRQYGTALVDTVGPALLMGWSEVALDAPPDPRRQSGCHQRR